MNKKDFLVKPGTIISLKDFSTSEKGGFRSKEEAKGILSKNIKKMSGLQNMLYPS